MIRTLSRTAEQIISSYQNLPFGDSSCSCPYFNNEKTNMRASLRVLIGKGTPQEIIDEAELIALKEKTSLSQKSSQEIKKFLVDHKLGIDCSGFVYHVLEAEFRERFNTSLKSVLVFPYATSFLRRLIASWRPIENTNVKTFAHERNSINVDLSAVEPGDLIVLCCAKEPSHHPDHVVLVEKVEYNDTSHVQNIHYVHSFQWSTDGLYNHGIKQGSITITDPKQSIINQHWTEQDQIGEKNQTWVHFRDAKQVLIRRIIHKK